MPGGPGNQSRQRWGGALLLVMLVLGGCATAVHRTLATTPCPGDAESTVERPLSAADGKGLPPSGATTRLAAERAIPSLRREFGHAEVVDLDGRGWIRTPEAAVEIGRRWIILQVTLHAPTECPMNRISANGVPVFFQYTN